ncbi:MAG: hypothetical protein LBC30_03965 [Puniceicoccales bacterium]|nr:hypothetical protein [Puniceicoccales bacterium]
MKKLLAFGISLSCIAGGVVVELRDSQAESSSKTRMETMVGENTYCIAETTKTLECDSFNVTQACNIHFSGCTDTGSNALWIVYPAITLTWLDIAVSQYGYLSLTPSAWVTCETEIYACQALPSEPVLVGSFSGSVPSCATPVYYQNSFTWNDKQYPPGNYYMVTYRGWKDVGPQTIRRVSQYTIGGQCIGS